jgi:hypothetical protein
MFKAPTALISFAALLLSSPVVAEKQRGEKGALLTDQVCRDFATKLIKAVESGDLNACRQLYDSDVFVERILEGLEFRYSDREQQLAQWKKAFSESHVFYQQHVANVAQGGSFRLVGVHPTGAEFNLAFRILDSDGALRYDLYTLAIRKGGEPIISDIGVLGFVSPVEVLTNTLAHFTPYDGPDGRIHKDAPDAERLIMDKRVLSGMFQQFRQERYNNVCYFYKQLSEKMQKEKLPLLMALLASTSVEPDPALGMTEAKRNDFSKKLIELYRDKYPNDSAIELAAVDYYLNTQQFDSAIRSVDSVDKAVGGDPYLEAVRAGIYSQAGELELAREKADLAVKKLPDIHPVYTIAADVAVQQGDFQRAVELLAQLAQKFEIFMASDQSDDAAWTKFFASDHYQKWETQQNPVTRAQE